MSEEFIKVTDRHTHGQTHTRTEPLPELLSELKIWYYIQSIIRFIALFSRVENALFVFTEDKSNEFDFSC